MASIYEITYIPWENNSEGKPWKYSGSDYYDSPKYYGSPSSKLVHDWSEGLSVAKWWQQKLKESPSDFRKDILIKCSNNITKVELQALESAIQKKEDHRGSNKYFNKTNKHFNSRIYESSLKGMTYEEIYGNKKAKEIKLKRRESMKKARSEKYWSGVPEGWINPAKGNSYEEIYGTKKAKELKEKRRKVAIGRNNFGGEYSNKKAIQNGNHISQQKLTCTYCGKLCDKANYSRWHGDRCKRK